MIAELKKQIAELRERVISLGGITIEGYNRKAGRGGVAFSRDVRNNDSAWTDKTVVIVAKPIEEDRTLKVREARYSTLAPKPCTGTGTSAICFYEWYGTEFDVYPPLGTKAVDFAGDENTEAVTVPPKLTTRFHRIHREHDVWVVEKAATGSTSDVCLIHAGMSGTNWNGSFVRVVHMKPNASGTAFISAESTVPIPPATTALGYSLVRCWPGTDGNFWQYLQSTTGSAPPFVPSATAVYVGTQTIRGVEYVAPIFPINMFAPSPSLPAGDC